MAVNEFKIEETIDNIVGKWNNERLVLQQAKGLNFKIISSVYGDKLNEILEDHIVQLSGLKTNIYIGTFIGSVGKWENILNVITDIFDLIMVVQKKFLYFNNIFNNIQEEIGQLIGDKNSFNKVKINFIGFISQVEKQNQNIREVLFTLNLKQSMKQMSDDLDSIQKNLKKYLEKRRIDFPRFYFLSDEDMFEILGKVKDPVYINKYMKKMFEGIKLMDFVQQANFKGGSKLFEFTAIISSDGERLDLISSIELNGEIIMMMN